MDINEDAATVKKFVDEQGLTFEIFLDSGAASQSYQVSGIPNSFFINREGVIEDEHIGAVDLAYLEGLVGGVADSGSGPTPLAQATQTAVDPAASPVPGAAKTLAIGPESGLRAPDIVLKGLDGREAKVSDFLGKRILLNFWTTW